MTDRQQSLSFIENHHDAHDDACTTSIKIYAQSWNMVRMFSRGSPWQAWMKDLHYVRAVCTNDDTDAIILPSMARLVLQDVQSRSAFPDQPHSLHHQTGPLFC